MCFLTQRLNLTKEQYNEFQANAHESREEWESRIWYQK